VDLGYRLFLEDERRKLEAEKDILLQRLGELTTAEVSNGTEADVMNDIEELNIKLAVLRQELQKLDRP
jgi:hypothetical protein